MLCVVTLHKFKIRYNSFREIKKKKTVKCTSLFFYCVVYSLLKTLLLIQLGRTTSGLLAWKEAMVQNISTEQISFNSKQGIQEVEWIDVIKFFRNLKKLN